MVQYPDLSSLNNNSGIAGLLALPNSSYPYFWAWIMFGIWIIMVLTMFFTEKSATGRGKILSSMSVACLAIIILSSLGSIFGIISVDIMVYILVISMIIIGIWFFRR